jgi:hypothetical protein
VATLSTPGVEQRSSLFNNPCRFFNAFGDERGSSNVAKGFNPLVLLR